MQSQNNQWAFLAGVRFFLAMSVVTSHCYMILGSLALASRVLWTFGGFTAVIGFFLISGYSIAHSIEQKPAGYARRRFLRIYPVFFISLLFGLLPFVFFGHSLPLLNGETSQVPSVATFIATLFMLNGILYSTPVFIHPFWSLSCEGLYYCLAPMVRKLSSRNLLLLTLVSAVFYVMHVYHASKDYPDEVHGIAAIGLFWAWLMGFAYFQFRHSHKLLVMLALLGTAMLFWHGTEEGHFIFVTYFLVVFTLLFSSKIGLSPKWVRFLNYLGEISYPLYLTHWTVLILLSQCHLMHLGYLAVPICWLCTVAVSILTYHLIDAPIRRHCAGSKITKHVKFDIVKA